MSDQSNDYPVVHVFEYERIADFYFTKFVDENDVRFARRNPCMEVVLNNGEHHFFMGFVRFRRWCRGRVYKDVDGVIYRSNSLLVGEQMEVEHDYTGN